MLPESNDGSVTPDDEEPAAKHTRLEEGDNLSFILRAQVKASAAATVSEFDMYLAAANSDDRTSDDSVLSSWQQHASQYPKCAHLARKYLSILATSVQSEHLFSATGRLITKQRTRLIADHADCLVFLNKNLDLF